MRSNCFHKSGNKSPCHESSNPYMVMFGIIEIFLSQIPDFDQIWWLSIIASIMSFTYSSIGLGLGVSTVAGKCVCHQLYIIFLSLETHQFFALNLTYYLD